MLGGDGAVEDEVIEVQAEEIQAGSHAPQKMANPRKPSEEEVEEHGLTHLPF